jgi:hypothetical protein
MPIVLPAISHPRVVRATNRHPRTDPQRAVDWIDIEHPEGMLSHSLCISLRELMTAILIPGGIQIYDVQATAQPGDPFQLFCRSDCLAVKGTPGVDYDPGRQEVWIPSLPGSFRA